LKKNIHDSDLGLDFIEQLRPVSCYFKTGKPLDLLTYGFIAQDVEQALGKSGASMVTRDKTPWEPTSSTTQKSFPLW
jgi:hypothetical protein